MPLFSWISFLCTGNTLLWQLHYFTGGLCYMTCSATGRARSSPKHRLGSLIQQKEIWNKWRTRKSNTTLLSKWATEAFSSLKHRSAKNPRKNPQKTKQRGKKKKTKLLFPLWCSFFPFSTLTRVSMRAQEIREHHQHIHFARKRQCGNKAQTNPANLEYFPLTTVTLVISSRSFRNCKEEHMVNKTAWQRRIRFSASLWPSANTWQDEVPRDTCSDSSPLLHSVWWTGSAKLYQELRGTERLLSFGRSELSEQLSHFTRPALWLPSLEQAMFPVPKPLCILVSISNAPWAAQHPGMSPLELGCTPSSAQLCLDSTKQAFISLKALQELQVSAKHSSVGCAPPRAHCWVSSQAKPHPRNATDAPLNYSTAPALLQKFHFSTRGLQINSSHIPERCCNSLAACSPPVKASLLHRESSSFIGWMGRGNT